MENIFTKTHSVPLKMEAIIIQQGFSYEALLIKIM